MDSSAFAGLEKAFWVIVTAVALGCCGAGYGCRALAGASPWHLHVTVDKVP